MRKIGKIAIIGVGLIGGSIGLAVMGRKMAKQVIGVCRRESSRKKALRFKAVHSATLDFKKAVTDADLVILAVPAGKIVALARKVIPFMKNGAVLTDVGSSKVGIVREVEKLAGGKVSFVGGHPMAGSDRRGVSSASSDIFRGASVILTKTKNTRKKALLCLGKFWRSLGCDVFVLSPAEHDRHVSFASYLPHAVSFALSNSQTKNSVKFGAGSLRDATRVSLSDPDLWKDILLLSREDVLKSIKKFSINLRKLETAVKKKDRASVRKFLSQAKKISGRIKR